MYSSRILKKFSFFILLMSFSAGILTVVPADNAFASSDGLFLTVKGDSIVVFKRKRKMQIRLGEMILREYPIALGFNPVGPKEYEGDGRTPEGRYTINWKNPNSDYFLSLKISYPNARDIQRAKRLGDRPGNMIMIHGLPNDRDAKKVGHPDTDWTNGCIAVNNSEIIELWEMINEGTPITIFP